MPVALPTAATDGLLLVHVPPEDALARLILEPAHTGVFPVIEAGNGLTVKGVVARQPVLNT